MKFFCRQRGCSFEAETAPDNCPVCNNPANFEIVESEIKNNSDQENEQKENNESN